MVRSFLVISEIDFQIFKEDSQELKYMFRRFKSSMMFKGVSGNIMNYDVYMHVDREDFEDFETRSFDTIDISRNLGHPQ